MNKTTTSVNQTSWPFWAVVAGLLVWMLTGCAHHHAQARYQGGAYVEPPPAVYAAPPAVYAAPAAVEVEASGGSVEVAIRTEADFYQPLTPYGRWEVVGGDGRCWIPSRVDPDWRPYCNGNWQSTEAGWYWASDEPWGWATYHYGRWDLDSRFGWYWVPQTQWAPAWVSWHEGGGYIGWAPLRPSARFGRSGAIEVDARVMSPRAFVFVEERNFMSPVRPKTVVVNNTTIINKTVNITKVHVVNKTVVNEGPRTTVIEQASGRKVQAVPVRELRHQAEATVAKQRPVPAVTERKTQTPVRTATEPRDVKPTPAREPRAVERPVATTPVAPPVVTREVVRPVEQPKRAATLDEAKPGPLEKPRPLETEKSRVVPPANDVKPAAERRAEAQAQKEEKTLEKRAVQQEKLADKPAPEPRAKREPVDKEPARTKAPKEDQNKKGEDDKAPAEKPAP